MKGHILVPQQSSAAGAEHKILLQKNNHNQKEQQMKYLLLYFVRFRGVPSQSFMPPAIIFSNADDALTWLQHLKRDTFLGISAWRTTNNLEGNKVTMRPLEPVTFEKIFGPLTPLPDTNVICKILNWLPDRINTKLTI